MNNTQTVILSTSVVSLITAALIVGLIERRIKPRERALSKQRNLTLWKFHPVGRKERQEMLDIDKWSLRKLWFAGSMIASSMVCVTVKRLGIHSLVIGGVIIAAWTFFLMYFWFFEVMKKYENIDNITEDGVDSWKSMNRSPTSSIDVNNLDKQPIEEKDLDTFINDTEILSRTISPLVAGMRSASHDQRLPLTIITGFLGSGKTTLIKNILNNTTGIRILVIENEIGEEGVDHDLLLQQTNAEDIILLNNGCVCCTVRKDIIETFDKIFSDEILGRQLDWVIIETTGLANPAPLIQTLYMDEVCQSRMRLDSVITIVDAKHFSHHTLKADRSGSASYLGGLFHRNEEISEAVQQILYADRIILNKIDLIPADDLKALKIAIAGMNSHADILTCRYGDIDIDLLLNIRAFDPRLNTALLSESSSKPAFQIPVDSSGKILHKEVTFGMPNSSSSSAASRFRSISLVTNQALDLDKFNAWISKLLEVNGKDIYRLKGILDIHGYEEMFVAHGVHMIFDGQRGALWPTQPDQPRQSKLVIIGMDLAEEELRRQFDSCIYHQIG
jgi:G3E family GTPase